MAWERDHVSLLGKSWDSHQGLGLEKRFEGLAQERRPRTGREGVCVWGCKITEEGGRGFHKMGPPLIVLQEGAYRLEFLSSLWKLNVKLNVSLRGDTEPCRSLVHKGYARMVCL